MFERFYSRKKDFEQQQMEKESYELKINELKSTFTSQ
jgi:hypothetical protein